MIPHESDRTIRQLNRFLTSPIAQGDGSKASLLNAVLTGDLADSQQLNETQWVVQLLEGGTYRNGQLVTRMLDPSSGSKDLNGAGFALQLQELSPSARGTVVRAGSAATSRATGGSSRRAVALACERRGDLVGRLLEADRRLDG